MGRIITFYSYKGGTGRSMALANLAWILASNGKNVLMVDWDLEAPGLHRYFAPFLIDKELQFSKGVIDAVVEFSTRALTPMPTAVGTKPWYADLANVENYVVSIDWPWFGQRDGKRGRLDLMPSGQQSPGYGTRVNSFNWDNFYERLGGGVFLDAMKESMAENYDYTLIDSRTGVSDTSGICTIHLPDTVVVCFTLNNQSIEGAASAAYAIARRHTDADGRQLVPVYPVAMRVDPFESDRVEIRRTYARTKFDPLIRFLGDAADGYLEAVEVPYRSLYAYEELLAPFGDRSGDPKTILSSFERLAQVITGGDVSKMPPLPEEERLRIRSAFAVIPAAASQGTAEKPATAAAPAEIYLSFGADAASSIDWIQQRLRARNMQWTSASETERSWDSAIRSRLASCRAYVFVLGPAGQTRWQKRELAIAREHQRVQSSARRSFEIIPVLLPGVGVRAATVDFPIYPPLDLGFGGPDEALENLVSRIRSPRPGMAEDACPYMGADSYPESAENVFFGRDAIAEDIVTTLGNARVTIVEGARGVGKSSLIQAGVIPRLRRLHQPRWETAVMAPGFNPFGNLVDALQSAPRRLLDPTSLAANAQLGQGLLSGSVRIDSLLEQVFRAMPQTERLLLVVDQFEDLLKFASLPERHAFLNVLAQAATRFPVSVLLVARRGQSVFGNSEGDAAIKELLDRTIEISALGGESLKAVIAQMIRAGNVTFEPEARQQLEAAAEINLAIPSILLKNARERGLEVPVSRWDVQNAVNEQTKRLEEVDRRTASFETDTTSTVAPAPYQAQNPPPQPRLMRRRSRALVLAIAATGLLLISLVIGIANLTLSRKDSGYATFFEAGLQAMTAGRYEDAVSSFSESIKLGGPGLQQRAFAYRQLSRYNEAREDLNQLVQADPKNPQFFRDRAYVNRLLGRYDDAISDYNRAIELEPNPMAYRDRAYLHYVEPDDDHALEDLGQAISLAGDFPEASVDRARLYWKQGKIEEARKDLEQAVKIKPDDTEAQGLLEELRAKVPQPITVYLRVPRESEIGFGLEAGFLLEKEGIRVEPPQVVGNKAPDTSQLRYFRPDEAKQAGLVAETLTKKGWPTSPQLIQPTSSQIPPPKQFEWWLGLKSREFKK